MTTITECAECRKELLPHKIKYHARYCGDKCRDFAKYNRKTKPMEKPKQLLGVEDVVCNAANVKPKSLNSRSKARNIADARHCIWTVAYEQLGLTYAELATLYDRDYTAIMHGVKRMTGTPLIAMVGAKLASKYPEYLEPVSREPGAGWKL